MRTFNKIRKISLLILALFLYSSLSAQLLEPVKWSFKSNRINDTLAELQFTANIAKGWHLYSQTIPEDGPMSTVFTFSKLSGVKLQGKVSEPKGHTEYDDMFKMQVKFFETQAIFTQKVKITSNKPVKISGSLEFQTCDNGSCIPGNADFSFTLDGAKKLIATAVVADTAAQVITTDLV
jgi:DsbC/DsbD-like thiol-disulfide interchange protein